MKNAIGNKMLIVIFVPFILIFGALSAYISHTITQYVDDWIMLEIKGISEINAIDLEGRMYSVIVSVKSAADALEVLDTDSLNARTQADGIVKTLFDNRHVYNSWFAYEPEAFDGRDSEFPLDYPGAPSGRFIRSYIMEDGQIVEVGDMDELTLDDHDQSPWYVVPRDENRLYVDVDNELPNLYDYGAGDDPVYTLSVVSPIHDRNGKVIGCVGADMLFDDITFSITGNRRSAVAVFYPNGRIFYSPDLKYAEESVYTIGFSNTEQIMEAIESGSSLFLTDEYSIFLDAHAFTYFQPVNIRDSDSGSLYLYVATPQAEADATLEPMFILIIAIFGAALAVIAIMITYVFRRISKPIRNLTLAADAISQGDLETEIATFSNTNDEISLLSSSLHRMVEQFRVYIIRLEQAQDEMTLHTQIGEFIREPRAVALVMSDISAMLCRQLQIYKTTAVIVNDGGAIIAASYDDEGGPVKPSGGTQPFMYHSQTMEMLEGRRLLFLNTFAISEYNVKFVDSRTVSACIVPLRTGDLLRGYIILENKNKNNAINSGSEALLIYMADVLADWLSKAGGQITEPEPESEDEGNEAAISAQPKQDEYSQAFEAVNAIEGLKQRSVNDGGEE